MTQLGLATIYSSDTAPINGVTLAGIAPRGSILIDFSSSPPLERVNSGTLEHPIWTVFAGGTSLPGVTSDGHGGIVVAHAVTAGDASATPIPDYHVFRGSTGFLDAVGNGSDGDQAAYVNQGQPLTDDNVAAAFSVLRQGALNGHDYQRAAFTVDDETPSAAPLQQWTKQGATAAQMDSKGLLMARGSTLQGSELFIGDIDVTNALICRNYAILGGLTVLLYDTIADAPTGTPTTLDLIPGQDAYIMFKIPAGLPGPVDELRFGVSIDPAIPAHELHGIYFEGFVMQDSGGVPDTGSIYTITATHASLPELQGAGYTEIVTRGIHRSAPNAAPYWVGIHVDATFAGLSQTYAGGLRFPDAPSGTPIPASVAYTWPTFTHQRDALPQVRITTWQNGLRSPFHGANAVDGFDQAFAQAPALHCTLGGVGAYGVIPPDAQPTATVVTSTITDANAKATIKALIGIVNGCGFALITES